MLSEWGKVFAMTLVALAGLLLVVCVFNEMPDFLEWGAPAPLTAAYFALQTLNYLPITLPVALLVSTLFALGTLQRNGEMTAMRAAGLGIMRATRSLWFAGVALSLLLFALNGSLVPWATETSQGLKERAEFARPAKKARAKKPATPAAAAGDAIAGTTGAAAGAVPEAAARTAPLYFENAAGRRIWNIERLSKHLGVGYGARVYQNGSDGRPREAWLAEEARYDAARRQWTFINGRHLRYGEDGRLLAQPRFARVSPPGVDESPHIMSALGKKPRHLSIREIREVLARVGGTESPRAAALAVQEHTILASPFCCIIVIGLAVPFAVAGGRVNPMVGVSKSLLLFAIYYLLTNVSGLLGTQQHLAPALAAWLPNLFMLGLASWLCWRIN
jgi:lipopolysaccharide export system permease protein